jgi:succinate dehydrogenase / fumarate reductase cytochrome b subunit
MATSILHRASGVALYAGAVGLAIWLGALVAGPEAFAPVAAFLSSLLGQLALYGLTVAISYHFANGLRHLVWDSGAGFAPKAANASGWFVIAFALTAPIGIWALANL